MNSHAYIIVDHSRGYVQVETLDGKRQTLFGGDRVFIGDRIISDGSHITIKIYGDIKIYSDTPTRLIVLKNNDSEVKIRLEKGEIRVYSDDTRDVTVETSNSVLSF